MSSIDKLRQQWNMTGESSMATLLRAANQPQRTSPFDVVPVASTGGWPLTNLLLPVVPPPRKRERTFVVREVPQRTIELANAMLLAVNTDAASMTSIVKTFEEFRIKNPKIDAIDKCLLLFILDAVVQGLAASSGMTYMRTIVSAFSRAGTPIVSPLVGDLAKILEMIQSGEECDHAVDIDCEGAQRIIDSLQGVDKVVGFLMVSAGPRVADMKHMLKTDLAFEQPNIMKVYFRFTKNHRSRGDRYTVVVRPRFFPTELVAHLKGTGPILEEAYNVADFNKKLAEASALLGLPEGITSYSLRRRFIHDVIERNTTGDDIKWVEVVKATGHHTLEVLRNSYAKKFDNVL